jgi:hypothetical protein
VANFPAILQKYQQNHQENIQRITIFTKPLILCQCVPAKHNVLQLGIPQLGVAHQDFIPFGALQVEPLGDGAILTWGNQNSMASLLTKFSASKYMLKIG